MRSISIREIRNALSCLDELVAREGELIVTKRGRPIARIVPVQKGGRMPSHADLRKTMHRLDVPSAELLDEERERD